MTSVEEMPPETEKKPTLMRWLTTDIFLFLELMNDEWHRCGYDSESLRSLFEATLDAAQGYTDFVIWLKSEFSLL